jgi:hypothetical protein
MKHNIFIVIIITLFFVNQGCKVVEPHYTSIEKLYKVDPGMGLNKVNEILEMTPYDFYFNIKEGTYVYVYKYKHQYHKFKKVLGVPDLRNEEYLSSGGSDYYKEPANIYMTFDQKTGLLISYHTDAGRENAENIIKHENTLKIVNSKYEEYNYLDIPSKKKKSLF